MQEDAAYLGLQIPELEWESAILSRLKELQDFLPEEAILNLWIWRKGGGRYLPKTNSIDWALRLSAVSNRLWPVHSEGLVLGTEPRHQKPKGRLSNIKSCNGLIYVLAAAYAESNQIDDVLICNTDGDFLESSNSNLFILRENSLITAPLTDGCLRGIMREWLCKHARDINLNIVERSINRDDLFQASEIWLSNAISGIRWVKSFEGRNYGNLKALEAQNLLQKLVQS